jgi:ABC-type multidrug transport system fused ATPase/permease subunit
MSNPYFLLLNVSWRFAKKERRQYLLVYFLFIVCSIGLAVNPLLFGWLVDVLQRDSSAILSTVWIYVGLYVGLHIIVSAIHGPTRVMERQLAFNISRNFLDELFHKLLHLPVNWHQGHHSGSTVNRLRKAYGSLKGFFQNGFFYFYTFAQFIFSLGGMLYFSPGAGAVALLLGVVTIWVILQFDKPFIKSLMEVNEKEHLVSASLADSLGNIFTVITLRLEGRMKSDLLGKFKSMFEPFKKNIVINEWKWFTANILISVIYVVMVVGYIYGHYKPGETFYLGGLVALLGFVNQFTNAFSRIAQAYTEIVGLSTDVRTVKTIEDAYNMKDENAGIGSLSGDWKFLGIRNLNFYYDPIGNSMATPSTETAIDSNQTRKGLQDINIHLTKGQRIALIGESGSGKSTLLALLRGLYDPQPGVTLEIDGKMIDDWKSLSNTVTLFPQEPEIFENTILYNITLGLPFSAQEVEEVCDIACLTDVISMLPNGLNSSIQEKGVNLSVGQKQRLALARGVLAARSSTIILLDEPTSSVDSQTEILIYRKMFEAFSGRVIISSLHSLHLMNLFDYGYVLNDGKIAEKGTSEQLSKGDYLRLSNLAMSSEEAT